ncbi:MAG: DoxX family membrane protein [Nitrospinota bacterium]|nr:DoxX family membrane protein [Nitrospinota bacterium]
MFKNLVIAARVVLGLIFVVASSNYFFHFFDMPSMGLKGKTFLMSLGATGYLMTLIKLIELIGGALLMVGFFVPLAIFALAPIVLNIILFHVFLDTGGMPIAIVLGALEGFLGFSYWDSYRRIFEI